ncbi:hypothetical protein [Orbus mooreae]|uniref:hypothetical protein n=1 Tax=Orbus mooreae TaxID=3074107 RepID=UPI00370D52C5
MMTYPAVYILFIGGAADKEPFIWQNIKLPFSEQLTHHSVGALAKFFSQELSNKLSISILSEKSEQIPSYKIDYLGYHEVFFEELQSSVPEQAIVTEPSSERYQKIKQHIGKETKVYIVGHSLGGWNGAHLSYILSQLDVDVECLITLDPVGTGNHEVALMNPLIKKAQIYTNPPLPVAKYWFNIQAHHIDLKKKKGSWFIEDWVAWAGGQWLITQSYPTVMKQVCEKANLHHKSVCKMFTYRTRLGLSPHEYLLNAVMDVLK